MLQICGVIIIFLVNGFLAQVPSKYGFIIFPINSTPAKKLINITVDCNKLMFTTAEEINATLPISDWGAEKAVELDDEDELEFTYKDSVLNQSLSLSELNIPEGGVVECKLKHGWYPESIGNCTSGELESNPNALKVADYKMKISKVLVAVSSTRLYVYSMATSPSGKSYSTASNGKLPTQFEGKQDMLKPCMLIVFFFTQVSSSPINVTTITIILDCSNLLLNEKMTINSTVPIVDWQLEGVLNVTEKDELEFTYNNSTIDPSLSLTELGVLNGSVVECTLKNGSYPEFVGNCTLNNVESNPNALKIGDYTNMKALKNHVVVSSTHIYIYHLKLSRRGNPYLTSSIVKLPNQFEGKQDKLNTCVEKRQQLFIFI
ncbi:hypothetical protein M3Y97_01129400 [Aphelenchoides bicaudatus]|nr:hypothetical protein M3Y97_01129400 [Aphelenchoides bicaudatus]